MVLLQVSPWLKVAPSVGNGQQVMGVNVNQQNNNRKDFGFKTLNCHCHGVLLQSEIGLE